MVCRGLVALGGWKWLGGDVLRINLLLEPGHESKDSDSSKSNVPKSIEKLASVQYDRGRYYSPGTLNKEEM